MDKLLYELLKYKTVYLIVNYNCIKELYVVDADHQNIWCRSEIENEYCEYLTLNMHDLNNSWFLSEEEAIKHLGYSL